VRKEDGSVKLLVYRKKTHTDQYLSFQSHHPVHQKLGVIRTLLERCNKLITEEDDKIREKEHIKTALNRCGYPNWAIDRVDNQMKNVSTATKQKKTQEKDKEKSRGLVVLPYVKGMSEQTHRLFRKYKISTAMKPHTTVRQLLVHPKDKIDKDKSTGLVYQISCHNCDSVYIGETGRELKIRLNEHKKEVDTTMISTTSTRAGRKLSSSVMHKSAITDHAAQNNHIINWDETKIMKKEPNRFERQVKEAIVIRKSTKVMNRDEGAFKLSHGYDTLLKGPAQRGGPASQQ